MQQLSVYKKEIARVEAENESLTTALTNARKKLTQLTNKSIQEVIVDD